MCVCHIIMRICHIIICMAYLGSARCGPVRIKTFEETPRTCSHTRLPHAFKRCHIIMCICHIISSHTCLPHAFGCATRTEECGRFVTEKVQT